MLSLTIKNICGKQVTIRSPVGSLPPGKEVTLSINVDDLEYLTSDLERLADANYITFVVNNSIEDINYWQTGRDGPFIRNNSGILEVRYGNSFTPVSGADAIGDDNFVTRRQLSSISNIQEMHKVTAGEETAGYFTLSNNPLSPNNVDVTIVTGVRQINKQCVGTTGAVPDFDVLITNRIHINGNGGATGLSGDIVTGDILIIDYQT